MQTPPAPPSEPVQVQPPEPQPAPPPKPHHVEETKPIPKVEPPLAVHNLTEQVVPSVVKPVLPPAPIVIEIDPVTVPQIITTEVQVTPQLLASLPSVAAPVTEVIEMTTHVAVPPHYQFLTPTFTSDGQPAAVYRDTTAPSTTPPVTVAFDKPVEVKPVEVKPVIVKPVDVKVPEVKVKIDLTKEPGQEQCKPILPEPKKQVKPEPECLGRKLAPGDVVDGDVLPPSEKKWNPAADNKVVRWFDMQWKSDGAYELVNWCVFMTHMELELRRL